MKSLVGWILTISMAIYVVLSSDGCSDGLYGPSCSLTCGQYCNNSRCETDPDRGTYKCTLGCIDGWTGFSCERKCPKGCKSCDQVKGTCAECKSSCCGKHCDPVCTESETCRTCKDTKCVQCVDGWYGRNCTFPCPAHCDSGCDKISGTCLRQCVIGYHGNFCTKPCTTTCMEGCTQAEGSCTGGCQVGWHGPFCNQSCSHACVEDKCYQVSGDCVIGVKDKTKPARLSRCRSVRSGGQLISDCSVGCEAGWRGVRCDQRCPEECYSCGQFPDGQTCIYNREVVVVHTYGTDHDETGRLEIRTVYAMLLVIPPFLIVGVVQMISVSYEKYKRHRDMTKPAAVYSSCPEKINTQEV